MTTTTYTIHARMMRSQIGFVYRATEHPTERPVAILIMDRQRVSTAHWHQLIDDFVACRWADTSGLLKIFSLFEHERYLGIVFEWFNGINVSQINDMIGAFPYGWVRRVATGISHTVQAIHQKGGFHGNIHLPEIFLSEDGAVRLTCPSLCRFLASVRDQNPGMERMGIPEEVVEEEKQAFDIFRIGIVLFQLTTGMELPLESDAWSSEPSFLVQVLDPSVINPRVPEPLRQLIRRAVGIRAPGSSYTIGEMLDETIALPDGELDVLDIGKIRYQLNALDPFGEVRPFSLMQAITFLESPGNDERLIPQKQYGCDGSDVATDTEICMVEDLGREEKTDQFVERNESETCFPNKENGGHHSEPTRKRKQIIESFLTIGDVLSAFLVAPDGVILDAVGTPPKTSHDVVGAILAGEFAAIAQLACDLGIKPCRSATYEYADLTIFCRPIGKGYLAVLARSSGALGAIRFKSEHVADLLASDE